MAQLFFRWGESGVVGLDRKQDTPLSLQGSFTLSDFSYGTSRERWRGGGGGDVLKSLQGTGLLRGFQGPAELEWCDFMNLSQGLGN